MSSPSSSPSSSSLSLLSTLGLPVLVLAVTAGLAGPRSALTELGHVFTTFSWREQTSVLAVFFAILFAAVGTSHVPLSRASTATAATTTSTAAASERKDNDKEIVIQSRGGASGGAPPLFAGSGMTTFPNYPLQEITDATTDHDKFVLLYPLLRDEIVASLRFDNELPAELLDWCRDMMNYNLVGGKLNRGITVLTVYRALSRETSSLHLARAAVLGWAIEFLQAFFLVADDVMDDSQQRRGQPCWYKLPHVGLKAINDAFLLESFVFFILKEHFGAEPFYADLVEVMRDTILKTECGQLMDLTSQPSLSTVDLSRFTIERYQSIVKYKTAFYTFYLPIALGMILAGRSLTNHTAEFDAARQICVIIGEYFQIQDDYLDCFGDPAVIGKVGTDIQENKCSWMVVQAVTRCNENQKKILKDNYGQWNDEKVKTVKKLYHDLKLPHVFQKYEETSYKEIQAKLKQLKNLPREVFEDLLKKLYKRSK